MLVERKSNCTVLLYAADTWTGRQHQTGDNLTVMGHRNETSEWLGCRRKVLGHLYLLGKNQVYCVVVRLSCVCTSY